MGGYNIFVSFNLLIDCLIKFNEWNMLKYWYSELLKLSDNEIYQLWMKWG